jgi:hypothetical protein
MKTSKNTPDAIRVGSTGGSAGSTLVDAALLIERIITHIDAYKDTPHLREQIALAAMGAHEIGPRLAKLAGIPWLPNTPVSHGLSEAKDVAL